MKFTIIALITAFSAAAWAAPSPQIDWGCTASCAVWNGCRVRNAALGDPLTQCGAEPSRCNCQQFANAKAAEAAVAATA
ncbi:hypothetical protein C1H76_4267 [Elsinoe australis]|uniref:Uncharacterized protein n=1 Tax=Elsinoe australis TaxID=40998 RepID=A0A2P8AIR8_9PEZI|nr:hypothetical protein B9Z65_523 [Elsinoe australis]TKX23201.1 hypothetical protein C1H76_4267 [Elsinoe australis]